MSSDLLMIGLSGAKAARTALDVTAQNISNASTEGYVRRSVTLQEVAASGSYSQPYDVSLSGVRVDHVVRNADMFRQAEVRRTGADIARTNTEVSNLENIEAAVEQSSVYPAMVDFEGSLQRLASDPTDPSLRAGVMEAAQTVAGTFAIASNSLDGVASGLHFDAQAGVDQVNTLATELARVNLRLARAADASSDQTSLLDQRDNLLQQISAYGDIATSFATDGTVSVQLGGSSGPTLVQQGTTNPLAMTTAANGTISFTVGGNPAALAGGSLEGQALSLNKLAQIRTDLDAAANSLITTANTAQGNGVALNGTTGQPLFSGTGASNIALAFTNGAGLATAPAGAAAGSRDTTNLNALRSALTTADPTGKVDAVIFDISSTVASRKVTQSALQTIATNAKVALETQAGVNLDQEAANLLRFQQAFQASSRAMQVASTIFDTLLSLK